MTHHFKMHFYLTTSTTPEEYWRCISAAPHDRSRTKITTLLVNATSLIKLKSEHHTSQLLITFYRDEHCEIPMLQIATSKDNFDIPIVTQLVESDSHHNQLRDALAEAGVLCLRMARKLKLSEFEALAEIFGPIKEPIGRTKDGKTFQYSPRLQHIDAGYVLTEEDRKKFGDTTFGGLDDQRPGLFETFHCDDTFTIDPAQLTILHARALPVSGGGPTYFMDMRHAFDLLPETQQIELSELQILYAHNNDNAFPPRRAASSEADCLVEVIHPLIRTHPITDRRALFVDLDRAKHIVDMTQTAGRQLLQSLQDHAETHAQRCHHDWQHGDVLIWDNASVQHKASGNFILGEERRFWRHMVSGPRPA
ncbi:MAG: alpha-ketoglutarate-dependent taurine dioxygenase [Planctomycetaceae bacterium]|jgi:alpha-ketoglutarate-dependent taurine dioxygenase